MGRWFLLAQNSFREQMGQGIRREGYETQASEVAAVVLYLLGAIALVVLIDWSAKLRVRWLASPRPHGMFRELCRVHHLRRRERRVLRKLAAKYAPEQPGAVFVWPEVYELVEHDEGFSIQERARLAELWLRLGPETSTQESHEDQNSSNPADVAPQLTLAPH